MELGLQACNCNLLVIRHSGADERSVCKTTVTKWVVGREFCKLFGCSSIEERNQSDALLVEERSSDALLLRSD